MKYNLDAIKDKVVGLLKEDYPFCSENFLSATLSDGVLEISATTSESIRQCGAPGEIVRGSIYDNQGFGYDLLEMYPEYPRRWVPFMLNKKTLRDVLPQSLQKMCELIRTEFGVEVEAVCIYEVECDRNAENG